MNNRALNSFCHYYYFLFILKYSYFIINIKNLIVNIIFTCSITLNKKGYYKYVRYGSISLISI